MSDAETGVRLWCTTHNSPHPCEEWELDCVPSANSVVNTLADIIAQAREAGIHAGTWSLARWIFEQWPMQYARSTVPDAMRAGTMTSRQTVDEVMALIEPLNPDPQIRDRIRHKVAIVYGAGLISGRAARQPEINALMEALMHRQRGREEPS